MDLAAIPLLDLREQRLTALSQTQLAWDHLLGEVPLTDEQRNHKYSWRMDPAQHPGKGRVLLPEAGHHLGEAPTPAQFLGMLMGRGRRIGIHRRPMSQQHQRSI
jgi:hypothetical protein